MKNLTFIQEHYAEQVDALNSFIEDAYKFLPNQDYSRLKLTFLLHRTNHPGLC